MANSLKMLSKRIFKNHGIRLIPTFDGGIRPGSVLEVKSLTDVNHLGHVKGSMNNKTSFPVEIGPTPALISDFNNQHELNINGAVELLRPSAQARAYFKRAKSAVATFGGVVTYRVDLFKLEEAIEKDKSLLLGPVGQTLRENRKSRIVYQIFRSTLSFTFVGSGGIGIDLKAELGNLKSAKLDAGWKWQNKATLESKKEILVAVEAAKYSFTKKRLCPER
ncbi:MAG: hypothetical protein ACYSW4_02450 [Planctomycetota bacterium]